MADKRVRRLHKGYCPTGQGLGAVMKTSLSEAVWNPGGQEEAEWAEGLLTGHCSERERGRRRDMQVQRLLERVQGQGMSSR